MTQQAHATIGGNSDRGEVPALIGGEQVVYSWYTDRCSADDTPDTPPRAFRDFSGDVHLVSTHEANRALVGRDFAHFRHECAVIYQGSHSDDPSRYSDRQWLTSFYTEDGRRIHALVHNE